MGILTRYLLRSHAGPFLFAFTALTGLLFLNAVAQRLQDLVGKGLSWEVILEFAVLSLPHTVALTLPMAVLVAVLYTFSDLTANNEVTAMSAGGVKPSRILLPMVAAGAILTMGMLYFNDQVLPEANHRLKNLLVDLGNKSPTFELREQVLNDIRTEGGSAQYFLRAARIDRQSNDLYDVAIYDVSGRGGHRTTYADSGSMAFNQAGTDLYLTLYDGMILEVDDRERGGFRRVAFQKQVVPLRGVGDVLERRTGGGSRSDREMTVAMLARSAREKNEQRQQVVRQMQAESRAAVEEALGLRGSGSPGADGAEAGSGSAPEDGGSGGSAPDGETAAAADSAAAATGNGAAPGQASTVRTVRVDPSGDDLLTRSTATEIRSKASRARALELAAKRYRVEIHKKFSIAFACLVFVLIGAPIAVRFPRGGVGMTIAVSVGVFGIYWMGLIGGEKLADKGVVAPAPAMWTPNAVFFIVGVLMSLRMGRWIATARGGGWDDLKFTLTRIVLWPVERVRRLGQPAAATGGGTET